MIFNLSKKQILILISGTLNPNTVPRPNVMQSSPSPTSIIASINQSNYLCSQTPEPPTTTAPQIIPYKDNEVFQRPMQNSIRSDFAKPFKRVIIVQQETTNVTTQPETDKKQTKENYIENEQLEVSYKTADSRNEKKENYDLKNLVINNYVEGFPTTQEMFTNQQPNRNEYTQQTLKINNFNYEKQKFYLSALKDSEMHVHNDSPQTFGPTNHNCETSRDGNNDNIKAKSDDLHQVSMNNDVTLSNDTHGNNPPND